MKREHIWAHHECDATLNWKLAEGGYASRMSIKVGETLSLHISNSRSYYEIFIFREGAQRQLVKTITGLRGTLQPVPAEGYRSGFCWRPVTTFVVPDEWKSGVYLATFATGQGLREILFVVRPNTPGSPLLLTVAANTYYAYNNVGGKSFYNYISTDQVRSETLTADRPFQWDCMGNFYIWDQFFINWLEAEGYAVDYCVNGDHDTEPDLLSHYHANVRIGHDEYNSRAEIEQLQTFVRQGGNLLLFCGNSFWFEIELRRDQREIFCWKPHYHDVPTPENPESSMLSYTDNLRQKTIGVFYTSYVHSKTTDPEVYLFPTTSEYGFYRVIVPEHWVFAGTGLQAGDELGRADSIVGVEADAADLEFVDGRPRYTGRDGVSSHYQILALGDAHIEGHPAYATVAINETEFKGTVFNAATIEWGHGLYRDDSIVARITRNVLNRLAR